jgi:ubiquinone/menaquinone biosynthesis C-methylase UbiE/uncharacterized protein YbaR (Trm112 family)
MKRSMAELYVCPITRTPLQLSKIEMANGDVISGLLSNKNGSIFKIRQGIPDFTYPPELESSDFAAKQWYDSNADVYDEYLPLTFKTFGVDEISVRNALVDKLRLKPEDRVLELGAGTGRDSVIIAQRLSQHGELYMQDISLSIFEKCFDKMAASDVPTEFHLGNACYLPFPDNFFDATFHFGGLNTFSDISRFFSECIRVTKVGGRIVVGDESMPVWLRKTDFAKILMNSNPHYCYDLPLSHLPVEARNVNLEWIIGGVFYVIDFDVGSGVPEANFDFEIPGPRGGTHRTRYYGHLEGVSSATKALAQRARSVSGKSMHQWLDDAIAEAARREIEKTEEKK